MAKVATANKMMGLIRRSYKFLNAKTFIPLYKSLVRVHLDYAASVWSPSSIHLIDELEAVQRRATKLLPGFKDISYEERLRRLRLPTLAYRRIRSDMIETYKIIQEIYDRNVLMNIGRDTRRGIILRGHAYQLEKKHCKSNIRRNSFKMRIVNVWNNLPHEVVSAESLNSFKNKLDKHWSNKELLYDYRGSIDRVATYAS